MTGEDYGEDFAYDENWGAEFDAQLPRWRENDIRYDRGAHDHAPEPFSEGGVDVRGDVEGGEYDHEYYERLNRHNRHADGEYSSKLHREDRELIVSSICEPLGVADHVKQAVLEYLERLDLDAFGNYSTAQITLALVKFLENKRRAEIQGAGFDRITEDEKYQELLEEDDLTLSELTSLSQSVKQEIKQLKQSNTFPENGSLDDVIGHISERKDVAYGNEDIATIIGGFYDGKSDVEIGEELDGEDPEAVRNIRHLFHLVDESDYEKIDLDVNQLRGFFEGMTTYEIGEILDVPGNEIRKARSIIGIEKDRQSVNDRYRKAFDRILNGGEAPPQLADFENPPE